MKFLSICIVLLCLYANPNIEAQANKTIMKDGIKLNLKSEQKIGTNASLMKYCENVSRNQNCHEIIITKSGAKSWIPFTSGPMYNLIKTGSIPNFNGMSSYKSKNGKLVQYYSASEKQLYVITPIKKSYIISTFSFGAGANSNKIGAIFKDNGKAPGKVPPGCENWQAHCIDEWQACYIDISINLPLDNPIIDDLLKSQCDFNFRNCRNDPKCAEITIDHVQTIVIFKNNIAAGQYQLGVKEQ